MSHGKSIHLSAPCKINVHLRVLDKRNDGFHGIESVFQLISLADEIELELRPSESGCVVVSPLMTLPEVNTLTRAVDLFREATGFTEGVRIKIQKRVPAGAGLGGGSSDAAAVLFGLNALMGKPLPGIRLSGLAARIGSDVPFFLSASAAVVTGRGEIVRPIKARRDLFGVLIWPEVECSTAFAYGLVDIWHKKCLNRESPDLEAEYLKDAREWRFFNSFTDPVSEHFPVIRKALADLRDTGSVFSDMTGSGSAVFGLFDSEARARTACETLSTHWKKCEYFLLLAYCPFE